MENYSYSSYPDSGDSSPRSREIECDPSGGAAASWDDLPPPSARVKLMCSYGGRIQIRSRDNQLAYVGGDTKILAVDRSVRYPAFVAKFASLYGSDDVILKYQLPGEDLDALISVTNDEDLEHMMLEYDRLHRTATKPVPRLRLFLFPAYGKANHDRTWFADAPPEAPVVTTAATVTETTPDFLFGFDKGFVPPPAVKTKETEVETVGSEPVPVKSDPEIVASPAEIQKPQIAENSHMQQLEQQPQKEEIQPMAYHPEFYAHQVQEKAPEPPSEPAPPTYWQDHQRNMVPPQPTARFASIVSGDQQFFLIPANSGVFPTSAAHGGQGFYTAMQRVIPATAYAMAPPPPTKPAYDNGVRGQQAVEVSTGYGMPAVTAYDNGAGYQAYDSAGRAVYYTGTAPTYQTVGNVALAAPDSKVLKPSQVS